MVNGNIEETLKAVVCDELCHGGRGQLEEYGLKNSKKGHFKKDTTANCVCVV